MQAGKGGGEKLRYPSKGRQQKHVDCKHSPPSSSDLSARQVDARLGPMQSALCVLFLLRLHTWEVGSHLPKTPWLQSPQPLSTGCLLWLPAWAEPVQWARLPAMSLAEATERREGSPSGWVPGTVSADMSAWLPRKRRGFSATIEMQALSSVFPPAATTRAGLGARSHRLQSCTATHLPHCSEPLAALGTGAARTFTTQARCRRKASPTRSPASPLTGI